MMGRMKLASAYRVVALVLAAAGAAMLLGSGPGYRFGLWQLGAAFGLLRAAAFAGLGAAALALVGLAVPRLREGSARRLAASLVVGLAVAYAPWQFDRSARSAPPIHDISTDTVSPPQFVAVVPLRAGAPNPPEYDGPQVAELQRKGYPDIGPLKLNVPVQVAFNRARDAAQGMGWEIVGSDAATGRIEATATTLWFGFKDDIVIRVTPEGPGSRIDVRSKSRVGQSDVGANAKRIRDYLASLRG